MNPTAEATSSTPDPSEALSLALQRAVANAGPSVLRLSSPRSNLATSATVWSDDGLIVTTHRGTRRAATLLAGGPEGDPIPLELVGRDPGLDLAVFRLQGNHGLQAIARADVDASPRVGTLTLALARPGWEVRASLRLVGVVGPAFRTFHGGRIDAWIETDRSLPAGFSGGPLVDTRGLMLGLDSRGLVRHADLAIPLRTIERSVAELLAHGSVSRGWLGISLVGVALPEGQREARDPETGVLITGLDEGGPAARAGLLVGDIIIGADGGTITHPSDLRDALRGKAGVDLELTILRAGARTVVSARPAAAS
ncbi:MAG: serine protease [Myxococcales bacterium]|nr:serine protease [Myxococcales bacterium]